MDEFPEIDCNTVMVYPRGEGIAVVDSRIFFMDARERTAALAR